MEIRMTLMTRNSNGQTSSLRSWRVPMAEDAFRFSQRKTTDLLFKELRSMKNEKPCSKMQIRALLDKADEPILVSVNSSQ